MSIPNLPVDFKDDILATTNQKRKYNLIQNDDGTVSFEDATEYQQTGSDFGAGQINETNDAINKIYSERILSLEEAALVTETGFFVDAMVVSELIGDFQRGYFSFSTEGEVIGPMEIKKIRINFSRKMRIMPSVFVQFGNESNSDGYRNMSLRVENMDTDGFTLVVSNNSNASYYPGIQWLATTI